MLAPLDQWWVERGLAEEDRYSVMALRFLEATVEGSVPGDPLRFAEATGFYLIHAAAELLEPLVGNPQAPFHSRCVVGTMLVLYSSWSASIGCDPEELRGLLGEPLPEGPSSRIRYLDLAVALTRSEHYWPELCPVLLDAARRLGDVVDAAPDTPRTRRQLLLALASIKAVLRVAVRTPGRLA